jgi:hypothetical protein
MSYFSGLLKDANIKKGELADILGLKPGTISAWKGEPPQYVIAYLELAKKSRECNQFLGWIKKWQA